MRTSNIRNTMESSHSKEESKRIRTQLGSIRDKLAEVETRVSSDHFRKINIIILKLFMIIFIFL